MICAVPTLAACGTAPAPPGHAWAVELTTNGRTVWTWKTSLPVSNDSFYTTIEPVTVGAVALFGQEGIVHGLDLADGHQLWSWAGGQSVSGMWPDGGLVAVLTDPATDDARLTGLDAATGAVRWSLPLPGNGLYGRQALTADGGLATVVAGGILQVVNLADGRIRWQRRTGGSAAVVAADGTVIYGINGGLTGYDDQTGRTRWTITGGLPQGPDAQLTGGLVLLSSSEQATNTLTAVIPATGRIAWRFDPGPPLAVLSAGPAGLSVATDDPPRLYLLDSRTGRVRWRADTEVSVGTTPLITKTAVISLDGLQDEGAPDEMLVDRDAANGRVQWQDALTRLRITAQQVIQVGPLVMLQGSPASPQTRTPLSAYDMTSGRLAWHAVIPVFVPLAPVLGPGRILVQGADLACGGGPGCGCLPGGCPADR